MQCDYAFLCDFAEDAGGKVHALGIGWTEFRAPAVPHVCPQIGFVACLSGTIAEAGQKDIAIRLIDADGVDVIPGLNASMDFAVAPPARGGRMNFVVNLQGIEFTKYGAYAVHVVVQGSELVRLPFDVVKPAATT